MKRFVNDTKGAVLAEFVVAIFPLLTVFFVFVQLSMLSVSALIVKHSAVVGARAAAVYSNEHQNVPELCKDNGAAKIDAAVKAAVGPWSNRIATTVAVRDQSSREEDNGVYDLVTVTVIARVRCDVPLGRIICGTSGTKEIIDIKSMPHQGARYKTRACGDRRVGSGVGGGGGGGRDGDDNGGDDEGGRDGDPSDRGDDTWGGGGGGGFGGGGAGGTW